MEPVSYTHLYRYPTSNEDVYWNGTSASVYDYLFYKEAGGPNMIPYLQDSLNSFYNNATNYFPVYFQTGKVTNANLQAYGGGEAMSYGIGLGYYDEKGVDVYKRQIHMICFIVYAFVGKSRINVVNL